MIQCVDLILLDMGEQCWTIPDVAQRMSDLVWINMSLVKNNEYSFNKENGLL